MIKYVDEENIQNKKILLRVDYNVTLLPDFTVADDERIQRSLPTLHHLLKNNNKLLLLSHLGRPEGRDEKYSLKPVAEKLQSFLPSYKIILISDFASEEGKEKINNQKNDEILLFENIRFNPAEKNDEEGFAKQLASLANVYVNDAFGVSHRKNASIVTVPRLIPSYGGLLLKKEVEMISQCIKNPQKPFIAVMGGAKTSTKIPVLGKLLGLADALLVGGGIANTLLKEQGHEIGKSIEDEKELKHAKRLLELSKEKNTLIVLPVDAVVAKHKEDTNGVVKKITEISVDDMILDIGPETEALFGKNIASAKTIVWNGPLGYFENSNFRRGTDFIYYSIAQNNKALSIVGGGETLAAISKKEYLDKITHVSTGGGAMLEFIEKGTLPGLTALEENI